MSQPYSQRGMTAISWLFAMGLIAFFALLALRLVPVYLDSYKVSSSLESLRSAGAEARSPGDLRALLMKRLQINSIRHIHPQQVHIENRGGVNWVNVAYETRKPLVGNIALVVSFDKSVEVPARP